MFLRLRYGTSASDKVVIQNLKKRLKSDKKFSREIPSKVLNDYVGVDFVTCQGELIEDRLSRLTQNVTYITTLHVNHSMTSQIRSRMNTLIPVVTAL